MAKNTKKAQKVETGNLASLLKERDLLSTQIATIEEKGDKAQEIERFALEGMRTKLASIDSQIGPQSEAEIVSRLYDACIAIQNDGLLQGSTTYLITFNDDGEPHIGQQKKRKSTGKRAKFEWQVDGETGSKATKRIVEIGVSLVLLSGEYKPTMLRGIAARKGWKIHPQVGSLVQHLKGKKSTVEGVDQYTSHAVPTAKGDVELSTSDNKMYAFKRALMQEATKGSKSAAVKYAFAELRDLLSDEMFADGVLSEGKKQPTSVELLQYVKDLQKIANKSDAQEVE